MSGAEESSKSTGQMSLGFATSETSAPEPSSPSTSSAGGSPARTCPPLAAELACKVLAAAYGTSSPASFQSFDQAGSWLKTLRQAHGGGSMPSVGDWGSSGMKRYRSRLRRVLLAHLTDEIESSSLDMLPTPSAARYGTSGNGDPHDGRGEYAHKGTPSLHTMASRGLLPTPQARDYKGPCPNKREGGKDLPYVVLEAHKLLPTPTVGDAKASGSRRHQGSKAHAGVSLTDVVVHGRTVHGEQHEGRQRGGRLNPDFVEWLMGLPHRWTVPG